MFLRIRNIWQGRTLKMSFAKIVITGGPCAGKTTGLNWIQNAFTKMGYTVLFVSEVATELISGGVAPWTCQSNLDYQKCQMRLQIEKEKIYEEAAASMKDKKVLIVCDRGALDNKVYMSDEDFEKILKDIGISEVELRDGYDAVFHLVTAAKGAQNFYTTANNTARKESPKEAAELDDALIAAWTGHPHLRILDNSMDFNGKMRLLIAEISSFLGEPRPYEIERKFLIEYPDTAALEALPNCRRVEIIQTYLRSEADEEVRIRQRGSGASFLYYETRKRYISGSKRIEIERRLSKEEYLSKLMDADTTRHPIRKTRYCLTSGSRYFEIDVYPFWDDKAIMEIELLNEDDEVIFPEQVKVIREVTDDPEYRNSTLAML